MAARAPWSIRRITARRWLTKNATGANSIRQSARWMTPPPPRPAADEATRRARGPSPSRPPTPWRHPPSPARARQLDAFQHEGKLGMFERARAKPAIRRHHRAEAALLEAVSIPVQHTYPVEPPREEDVQVADEGIVTEDATDHRRPAVRPLTTVDGLRGDEDLDRLGGTSACVRLQYREQALQGHRVDVRRYSHHAPRATTTSSTPPPSSLLSGMRSISTKACFVSFRRQR